MMHTFNPSTPKEERQKGREISDSKTTKVFQNSQGYRRDLVSKNKNKKEEKFKDGLLWWHTFLVSAKERSI